MVKTYELVVLVSSNLTQEQQKGINQAVEKLTLSKKGKVLNKEILGKKVLSYPIKKNTEAVYFLFNISLDTSVAQSFEREIRLMPQVIRSLFLIYEEPKEESNPQSSDTIEVKE